MAVVLLFDRAARMLLTSTVEVDAVELAKRELRVELVLIAAAFSLGRRTVWIASYETFNRKLENRRRSNPLYRELPERDAEVAPQGATSFTALEPR
jgi:hypothetical protein